METHCDAKIDNERLALRPAGGRDISKLQKSQKYVHYSEQQITTVSEQNPKKYELLC